MTSSRLTGKKAFTLLEILLVLLVVAIVSAAFLPVALQSVDQARTRSFLRQVISLNRYARSRAILDRSALTIVYAPEEGWVRLMGSTPTSVLEPGLEDGSSESAHLLERRVPDTMRIRQVTGAQEREGQFVVRIDAKGVGTTHTLEVVDPRGRVQQLRFNGITGEVDFGD